MFYEIRQLFIDLDIVSSGRELSVKAIGSGKPFSWGASWLPGRSRVSDDSMLRVAIKFY